MKVIIGIATLGRREQMSLTVSQISLQEVSPFRLVICPASPDDFDNNASANAGCPVSLVAAPKGSCAQRNAIIDASQDADIIVFIDDDFYMAPDYVKNVIKLFTLKPEVVVATGVLYADGAIGPGIAHDSAVDLIAAGGSDPLSFDDCEVHNGYGCNLAVRLNVLRQTSVRFDERLPLYGWLEDVDFSRRLAPYGRLIKSRALRGVHLATKKGKTSGVRFGYSQIANPLYMSKKGSVSRRFAYTQLSRNVMSNVVRVFRPEPWVDRSGRLKGNCLGFLDFLRGRLDPMRIVNLS